MSFWLTAIAALASALMGGVFFAFSSFVLPALGRIPPTEGIRAMQRINVDVFHWSFMTIFFGNPLVCLALAVLAFRQWEHDSAGPFTLAGAAVYLLGCFLVTVAGNVPRNNALAKVDADSVDAAREWRRFAQGWLWWNHVRTVACLVAAAAFLAALVVTSPSSLQ